MLFLEFYEPVRFYITNLFFSLTLFYTISTFGQTESNISDHSYKMNMCGLILPYQNHTLFQTKKAKSITLFQTKTAPKPYPLELIYIYRSTPTPSPQRTRHEALQWPLHRKLEFVSRLRAVPPFPAPFSATRPTLPRSVHYHWREKEGLFAVYCRAGSN